MKAKRIFVLGLAAIGAAANLSAQSEKTYSAQIGIEMNAVEYHGYTFTDHDGQRKRTSEHDKATWAFPFNGYDFLSGTNVSFSYDGGFFGGSFGLKNIELVDGRLADGTITQGMKAWVLLGRHFKVSAGTSVGSTYADAIDGYGLGVYDGDRPDWWDGLKNPDNIVENPGHTTEKNKGILDKGVVLEGLFGPVTVALAGQYFNPSILTLDIGGNSGKVVYKNQYDYGYGARIGSLIGDWGKLNVSYVHQYQDIAGNNYRLNRDGEAVPTSPLDTQERTHLFGGYASLTPPFTPGFAVTLGYNGIITQYIKEFWPTDQTKVETKYPLVFKTGLNLNLRYKRETFEIHTDHNYSFWSDYDYTIYNVKTLRDYNIMSRVPTSAGDHYDDYGMVNHSILVNRIGGSWKLSDAFRIDANLRHLLRQDIATAKDGTEYALLKDKIVFEPRLHFLMASDRVDLWAGIDFEYTITGRSKDLNYIDRENMYVSGAYDKIDKTTDTENLIQIPVGLTVRF
jgi:hypothetical protein